MAITVEVTYKGTLATRMPITMIMTQTVETQAEADKLALAIVKLPGLENAIVKCLRAKPLPTVDDAMNYFAEHIKEFPPRT